jgi:hypothetical protein
MTTEREKQLAGGATSGLTGLASTISAYDERAKALREGTEVTDIGFEDAIKTGKNMGKQVDFTYDENGAGTRPPSANSVKDGGFYTGNGSSITLNDLNAAEGAGGYAKSSNNGVSIPTYTFNWQLLSSISSFDGLNKVCSTLSSFGNNVLFTANSMINYEKMCLLVSEIFGGGSDDDPECPKLTSFLPKAIDRTQKSWILTFNGLNFTPSTTLLFINDADENDIQAIYPEQFTTKGTKYPIQFKSTLITDNFKGDTYSIYILSTECPDRTNTKLKLSTVTPTDFRLIGCTPFSVDITETPSPTFTITGKSFTKGLLYITLQSDDNKSTFGGYISPTSDTSAMLQATTSETTSIGKYSVNGRLEINGSILESSLPSLVEFTKGCPTPVLTSYHPHEITLSTTNPSSTISVIGTGFENVSSASIIGASGTYNCNITSSHTSMSITIVKSSGMATGSYQLNVVDTCGKTHAIGTLTVTIQPDTPPTDPTGGFLIPVSAMVVCPYIYITCTKPLSLTTDDCKYAKIRIYNTDDNVSYSTFPQPICANQTSVTIKIDTTGFNWIKPGYNYTIEVSSSKTGESHSIVMTYIGCRKTTLAMAISGVNIS